MRAIVRTPRQRRWGWLDDDFDQMFEGFLRPMQLAGDTTSRDLVPAVEVSETEDQYVVRAEMPGVRKDDIDVNLEDGILTISAETRSETEEREGERVIRQERRFGKYLRSLRLGTDVDATRVKAVYRDGVLELSLPKAEQSKPKKIEVKVA
ncbi:MAG: Hsp20/alpha crystallin family protein [Acidiferrobacteraceae bacterium]|jgi:HSP20 family protein